MSRLHFSQDQLVQVAKLSDADITVIEQCRRPQNKLGFAYQLVFVRLFNQFPAQVPFESIEDVVTYLNLQLDIPSSLIEQYKKRRETIAEHRKRIQEYLQLNPFHPAGVHLLNDFLYKEALQIEPTDSLLVKATHFLRDNHILNPADDTLRHCRRIQLNTNIFNKKCFVVVSFIFPDRRNIRYMLFPGGTEALF